MNMRWFVHISDVQFFLLVFQMYFDCDKLYFTVDVEIVEVVLDSFVFNFIIDGYHYTSAC